MAFQPRYRILIVDDDEDVCLVVKTALQPKYEVVTAHDGLDALEKLDRCEPDFVIMDLVMPLMDGLEACKAIRRHPRFKDVQVMFLSAHGSRPNVMKSYESGANLFLNKPIEPSRLVRNVDLYFEQTPPVYRAKRLSMRQIEIAEAAGKGQAAPAGAAQSALPGQGPAGAPSGAPSPVVARACAAVPSSPAPAAESLTTGALVPRILLVEDDRDLTDLLVAALSESFEVVHAADGLQAVEKMVKYQPDLMIVDVMLPKMNGYQLCQSVRGNVAYANVPILVLTAKTGAKDREYALKMGADAFLPKPAEMKELVECCVALSRRPGFQVRPKKQSAFDIRAEQAQEEMIRKDRDEKLKRLGRERPAPGS